MRNMSKFIAGASALALIAGAASAQTIEDVQEGAEVTQDGNLNSILVDQTGSTNGVMVEQSALRGFIDIDQDGADNRALVMQEDDFDTTPGQAPFFDEDPDATVSQSGTANDAMIDQSFSNNARNHDATITQSGERLEGVITQAASGGTARGNSANIDQTGADGTSSILQSTATGAENIVANITQTDAVVGSNAAILQEAEGTQTGDINADINQTGSGVSYIDQSIMTIKSKGVDATINQTDGGYASINQRMENQQQSDFSALINQTGDSSALIDQRGTVEGTTTMSATIDQMGMGNDALITQIDLTDTDAIGDGRITSSIMQVGSFNSADIFVRNRDNTATVIQSGNYSSADVDQLSRENSITVLQNGTGASAAEMNTADIDQNAVGATATIIQDGHSNTALTSQTSATGGFNEHNASVTQLGSDNLSDIDQFGHGPVGNTASVTQGGDGFASTVSQNGSGNVANVTQGLIVPAN